MRVMNKRVGTLFLSAMMMFGMSSSVFAHLMVAQHGTVNIVDDGAFMVLSVPMSAFEAVDVDRDGVVTMIEFNDHRAQIMESIRNNIVLSDDHGMLALEGIMLSPEADHDVAYDQGSASVGQLTVMGRFTLVDPHAALSLYVGLYGTADTEQTLQVIGTRRSAGPEHVLVLTPQASGGELFPKWAMN